MRFVRGPIPENAEFQPVETGWRAIREPNPFWMQVIAIPIIVVTALLLFVVISVYTVVEWNDVLPQLLVLFVLMIPVHELMHAVAHPAFGRTERTWIGFWPSHLLFYAHYEGELSRERFLLVLAAPTLALTVLPLAVCVAFRLNAPSAAALALANGIGAAGDLLGILLIAAQIPRGATVRNKGWRTYWMASAPA